MESLPDDADPLYDLAPEDFVAARDALAKRLRGEGDRAGATAVKHLRRPTVAAWALNQVVRRHRAQVQDLVDKGRAAAEAQQRALAGQDVDLRGAVKSRQDAVRQLVQLAVEVLAERGSASQDPDLVDAITAASTRDGVAEEVLTGRLDTLPSAPSGFGDLESMLAASTEGGTVRPRAPTAATSGDRNDERAAPPEEPEEPEDRARVAREEEDERRAALAEARKVAQAAADDVERSADAAREARRAVDEAAAEVRRAEAELQRARDEAEESSRRADDRQREAREAAQRLDEAERALERLQRQGPGRTG